MAQATSRRGTAELAVASRTMVGKATKHLRRAGVIPANIYGHKEASIAVQIDTHTFDRLRREHGLRSIIALRLPGEKGTQTVLVRHIQYDPLSGKILHVDFSRVSMEEYCTFWRHSRLGVRLRIFLSLLMSICRP